MSIQIGTTNDDMLVGDGGFVDVLVGRGGDDVIVADDAYITLALGGSGNDVVAVNYADLGHGLDILNGGEQGEGQRVDIDELSHEQVVVNEALGGEVDDADPLMILSFGVGDEVEEGQENITNGDILYVRFDSEEQFNTYITDNFGDLDTFLEVAADIDDGLASVDAFELGAHIDNFEAVAFVLDGFEVDLPPMEF